MRERGGERDMAHNVDAGLTESPVFLMQISALQFQNFQL